MLRKDINDSRLKVETKKGLEKEPSPPFTYLTQDFYIELA
jgi:hypothetical protein